MTHAEMGGRVLASVSRSFYLSIRLLPERLREPIGLAYLLARASDTIADSSEAPAELRTRHLAALAEMVRAESLEGVAEVQRDLRPPDPAERELLENLGVALEWLFSLEAAARAEIQRVLKLIIRGQMLDVERFGDGTGGEVRALTTAEELEEYTYLVAGCVGEFWTRVCFLRFAHFANSSVEEMTALGRAYGQGLQMVNVLRDLPKDLRAGRCYLPADELRAIGLQPADLLGQGQEARPLYDKWIERGEQWLGSGRRYLEQARPMRVRAACYLPWKLGMETLEMLKVRPVLETSERVKVTRRKVYETLARSALVAWTNAAIGG